MKNATWAGIALVAIVALALSSPWSVRAQELPASRLAGDAELTIPAGEYSAIVFGSRGGASPEFRLKVGEEEFLLVPGDKQTLIVPFAQGLRVRDNAAILIKSARGGGEPFAWGITSVGPVAFPEKD